MVEVAMVVDVLMRELVKTIMVEMVEVEINSRDIQDDHRSVKTVMEVVMEGCIHGVCVCLCVYVFIYGGVATRTRVLHAGFRSQHHLGGGQRPGRARN